MTQKNPFLSGNYAPIHDELDLENLEVIGKIPEDLSGVYMRNGPNPEFEPISYTYPFDGDGMIHAIYIKNSKASYKNRFVLTPGLLAERKAGQALYGGILNPIIPESKYFDDKKDISPFKNGAFIHVIRHANKYIAMYEGDVAFEIDRDLKTIGKWHPDGEKNIEIGPHTRLDPENGELWLINYSFEKPYLKVYTLDKTGKIIKNVDINKPYSTMMHDFVLTKNYVIFFDCPLVLDIEKSMRGQIPISWEPQRGTRIGIMNRKTNQTEWFETEPFFVFHFANAYEKNNNIIIDYIRHEDFDLNETSSKAKEDIPPFLYSTKIDLESKKIIHEKLCSNPCEFPRIREDLNSLENRYIYFPANKSNSSINSDNCNNSIVKFDKINKSYSLHDYGKDINIDEAVFAPKNNSKSEDDGYIMQFIYNKITKKSEFVILDAKNIEREPIARVLLPRRVPHGLHGSWLVDE